MVDGTRLPVFSDTVQTKYRHVGARCKVARAIRCYTEAHWTAHGRSRQRRACAASTGALSLTGHEALAWHMTAWQALISITHPVLWSWRAFAVFCPFCARMLAMCHVCSHVHAEGLACPPSQGIGFSMVCNSQQACCSLMHQSPAS